MIYFEEYSVNLRCLKFLVIILAILKPTFSLNMDHQTPTSAELDLSFLNHLPGASQATLNVVYTSSSSSSSGASSGLSTLSSSPLTLSSSSSSLSSSGVSGRSSRLSTFEFRFH